MHSPFVSSPPGRGVVVGWFMGRGNRTCLLLLSRNDAVEWTPHPGLLPFGRGEGAAFRHPVPTHHSVTRPSAGIDLPSPHRKGRG